MLYFDDFLSNDYLGYLCDLKEKALLTDYSEGILESSNLKTKKANGCLFSVSEFVERLLDYFLGNEVGIKTSLEAIADVLDVIEKTGCVSEFKSLLEARPIFSDPNSIKNYLNKLGVANVDDRFGIMKDAVRIALFNKWFDTKKAKAAKEDKSTEEDAKAAKTIKRSKTMEGIIGALKKAKSLSDLPDGSTAKEIAAKVFGKDHKSSGENSSLLKDLRGKTYQVNRRVTLGWELDMLYCLNDDESDLEKSFREHTLEGASVFGYDEWFKTKVFN